MNFKKLENNLLDMIQEQQVKIGYPFLLSAAVSEPSSRY